MSAGPIKRMPPARELARALLGIGFVDIESRREARKEARVWLRAIYRGDMVVNHNNPLSIAKAAARCIERTPPECKPPRMVAALALIQQAIDLLRGEAGP